MTSEISPLPAPQGIFPAQGIEALISLGKIHATLPVRAEQIQPASLDVRLGDTAWRVQASFLPGKGRSVFESGKTLISHRIDLTQGAVLETGCVYIIPLQEKLALPFDIYATCNPKSSTGRLDIFTRLIVDGSCFFDRIPPGYEGPLYAEVCPQSFPVIVRPGTCLSQLRFQRASCVLSDQRLQDLHQTTPLIGNCPIRIKDGVHFSIDLSQSKTNQIIGYRARQYTPPIDLDKIACYAPTDFWELVRKTDANTLILEPNAFYILKSQESICIPPGFAAEMIPFDPFMGEFRVHYAGFFDPGFGYTQPARAVFEVRSYKIPFILEHGQNVGRLLFAPLYESPRSLYGQDIKSNYQGQSLKLSKHFL